RGRPGRGPRRGCDGYPAGRRRWTGTRPVPRAGRTGPGNTPHSRRSSRRPAECRRWTGTRPVPRAGRTGAGSTGRSGCSAGGRWWAGARSAGCGGRTSGGGRGEGVGAGGRDGRFGVGGRGWLLRRAALLPPQGVLVVFAGRQGAQDGCAVVGVGAGCGL